MKKVLIITYTFPPNAGGGAQRIVKFSKYLPANGWRPVIVTVKKSINKNQDTSLLQDIPPEAIVHRTCYTDPQSIFFRLFSRNAAQKKNFSSPIGILIYVSEKIVNAINILLLIPNQTILWFPIAYCRAKKIIRSERPDVIFSSSLPPTTHIIAYFLKKKFDIPWVADFRDEWTQNPFAQYPTPLHRKINQYLEKKVLHYADRVTVISDEICDALASILPATERDKFSTVVNGYDPQDFRVENHIIPLDQPKFTVCYVGSIYDKQTPNIFIKAVSELIAEFKIDPKKILIRFVGGIAGKELSDLPKNTKSCIHTLGYKNHDAAIQYLYMSTALLLYISNKRGTGCYTAKIFEYLATGKPIIALVPERGVAASLIRRVNAGYVADPDSIKQVKGVLLDLYSKWSNQMLTSTTRMDRIGEFSRIELTKQLATLFNTLIQKNEKHGSL